MLKDHLLMAPIATYSTCYSFAICSAMKLCSPFKVLSYDIGRLRYPHGRSRAVSRGRKDKNETLVMKGKCSDVNELRVLYDDWYGAEDLKDFFDTAKDRIKPDGGPPRWFRPTACGCPVVASPTLLYLPGIDGTGLGLISHHKSLGKFFQVQCLHIPVSDRTPFEGLVKMVEDGGKLEHATSPDKPIYLLGDSLGGCIALSVAAKNPDIDLVVILVNPATSFARSQLLNLLPILEVLPAELHSAVPHLLGFLSGDLLKMAICLGLGFKEFYESFCSLLPRLNNLADIVPLETFLWKIRLLQAAASETNPHLHDVRAQVLVLASCKDSILPSEGEAKRLLSVIPNSRVRYFKDNGHSLLFEGGVDLMTIIKGSCIYRRRSGKRHDFISDFLPPSTSDLRHFCDSIMGFHHLISPVMFSTKENGEIVQGLAGVLCEGPVLLVGNHTLLGVDALPILQQFPKEKNIVVRSVARPETFTRKFEMMFPEFSALFDLVRPSGYLVPRLCHHLISTDCFPPRLMCSSTQGAHGEEYQLHWPKEPEFVRMAAKFGAKIVPFGVVGEDDAADVVLDYKDLMHIPFLKDFIREITPHTLKPGRGTNGKGVKLECCLPVISPKEIILKDREAANEMYLQVKCEIERNISYLLRKREEDPYRGIIDRTMYRVISVKCRPLNLDQPLLLLFPKHA